MIYFQIVIDYAMVKCLNISLRGVVWWRPALPHYKLPISAGYLLLPRLEPIIAAKPGGGMRGSWELSLQERTREIASPHLLPGGTGCDGGREVLNSINIAEPSLTRMASTLCSSSSPSSSLIVLWVSNQLIKYNHYWHLSGNMMLVDHNVFDLTKLLGRVNNKWFPKGGFLGSHRVRKMDDGDVKINTQSLTLLF